MFYEILAEQYNYSKSFTLLNLTYKDFSFSLVIKKSLLVTILHLLQATKLELVSQLVN